MRLVEHQFPCAKHCALHLIPFVYTYFKAQNQQELMEILNKVANDPMP